MPIVKVSKYILVMAIAGFLVVLPSINISDYVQSTITSKFIVFTFSCLLLFGGFILIFIISESQTIKISKLDIILLLLVGYITINRYFFQFNFGFSLRYIELLGLGVLYFILRSLSYKNYIWLLLAVVISGIIQAVYGNLQLLGYYSSNHSGFKLTGSFFNPGPYAGFLVSVFPIALGIYLFKEKIINQLLFNLSTKRYLILNTIIKLFLGYASLLGIISIILVIPATRSRASLLAVLISSALMLELRYQIIKKTF